MYCSVINAYVDISVVILFARILSLVDSLGSAHESSPEFLNVGNSLSYALYI